MQVLFGTQDGFRNLLVAFCRLWTFFLEQPADVAAAA